MDSSLAGGLASGMAGGLGAIGSPWSEPFLWSGAAALFAGLALGLVLRALRRSRRRADADRRLRSARFARAIAYLSLGILALAGLFVLADKGGLSEAWNGGRPALLAYCASVFLLGACAGRYPLPFGLPLACLAVAVFGLLGLALEGWLPLRSEAGSGPVVARLLPYKVEPASFSGQLELPERDSVPVLQDLSFASSSVGLRVECLELREPLRFAASIASRKALDASRSGAGTLRLYRIAGIATGGAAISGAVGDFKGPAHLDLIDAVLPLPPGAGLEPGSPPVRAKSLFGLARRTWSASPLSRLVALEPLSFELRLPELAVIPRPGR